MTTPLIAIYGATGHTGRLVAGELLSRGHDVVLAGRDAAALAAMSVELADPQRVHTHPAPLDDPSALRALAERAAVIVNCAGPFSITGAPVAAAAIGAGCHYIDHAVESHHVKHLFDDFQGPARDAGVVVVPGLSFYGGLGDLLASAVADGLSDIERVVVAYAVSGWRLTTAAKDTAAQLFAETERITFSDGVQHVGYVEPRNSVFAFPPPIGPRTMIAPFPSCEIVTIPRHVAARNVDLLLTAATFEEEHVFTSEHIDTEARARSEFTVAVDAVAGPAGARGRITGADLWRAAALASVEGAERLAGGEGPATGGVLSSAEAFPAGPFLRTLERLGAFTVDLPTQKG
ncbi:saccharopine dehydrogenase-like protein [Murinocardiopsis flavida]|uniref:Saccharopine dehydrogenase-like protein n=1 Tax=Murinocardiopsis flavida TaxID=645275 RepID=A0A2P8CT02_9ACTN|nr:saccharopine dehydrogenase NADP-binding domain-containing protein [Murinocardiopsis flavida]PSK88077.1 saccharopine dehydrogenase-like protein [Murinocardiopsis flavida]